MCRAHGCKVDANLITNSTSDCKLILFWILWIRMQRQAGRFSLLTTNMKTCKWTVLSLRTCLPNFYHILQQLINLNQDVWGITKIFTLSLKWSSRSAFLTISFCRSASMKATTGHTILILFTFHLDLISTKAACTMCQDIEDHKFPISLPFPCSRFKKFKWCFAGKSAPSCSPNSSWPSLSVAESTWKHSHQMWWMGAYFWLRGQGCCPYWYWRARYQQEVSWLFFSSRRPGANSLLLNVHYWLLSY